MTTHKMIRKLKGGQEYVLCTGKRADYAEYLRYHWNKVSCKKCLKMRVDGKA